MVEMMLRPEKELWQMYKELTNAMRDAGSFILQVYRTANHEWIDRCHSICHEQTSEYHEQTNEYHDVDDFDD